jgi:hypothetical protein
MVLVGVPIGAYSRTLEDRETGVMSREPTCAPDTKPGERSSENCLEWPGRSGQ